jgi:hypothetical protein
VRIIKAVALLFRRIAVNTPSSSGNMSFSNGLTDIILMPYTVCVSLCTQGACQIKPRKSHIHATSAMPPTVVQQIFGGAQSTNNSGVI